MFNLPLQISSIPSFKPQVSKIERTERTFPFSDSWSCAVGCPIAGRDLRSNVARFRLNTITVLGQRASGDIWTHNIPESRVCRDVSRAESAGDLFGGSSRHLGVSLENRPYSMKCDAPLSPTALANQFVSFIVCHCPPELLRLHVPKPRMSVSIDQEQVIPADAHPDEGMHRGWDEIQAVQKRLQSKRKSKSGDEILHTTGVHRYQ